MKKRILLLCIVTSILFSGISGRAHAAPKLKNEYKMSVNISDVTPQGKAVTWFAQEVKKRTNGKINIKIYWNGQLFSGKATNELLLMRKNVGDFSLSSLINWAPQFPEGNLFLLPWFISGKPDKYKALDAVEAGRAGKMLTEKIDKFGLKVLSWGEQGARELSNNKREITKPEDLKGMKIRVVGSPLFLDIFRALGANPMNISWAEALTALQQGTVDGQENPYSVIIPNRIYEFQRYITEWSYNMDPLMYVVHKKVWQSFPPDIQKTIQECALEAGMYNKCLARLGLDDGTSAQWLKKMKLYPSGNDKAAVDPRGFLAGKNVRLTTLTPQQIQVFAAKVKDVRENWSKKIGLDLVQAAEKDMQAVKY